MAKKIKETQCTCKSCGKVWYYGKAEATQNAGNAMQNLGKSMTCCCGCLPDKKTVDLNKCPDCGSKAVTKETVIHEI